jgi:UDP-N-acetylmuramate dehydrogenase
MLDIQQHVSLASKTTMGVGGPAEYYSEVRTTEDMQKALQWAEKQKIRWYIIGNASNILFEDEGFKGLIIHNKIRHFQLHEGHIILGSGSLINPTIFKLSEFGLSGLEKLFGVPGTIGGALFQNASAFGGCISDFLLSAQVLDRDQGWKAISWSKDDFDFKYRLSKVKAHLGKYIITEATFSFRKDTPENIKNTVQMINTKRQTKPIGKSVGSFFTNPDGHIAGQLIEAAGLKGFKVGGAFVSEIHANYLMNDGSATTLDILKLCTTIQTRVKETSGIMLEREVRVVPAS